LKRIIILLLFFCLIDNPALAQSYQDLRNDFIDKNEYVEQLGTILRIAEVKNIIGNSKNITSQFDWYLERHPDFERCTDREQMASWFNGHPPDHYPVSIFEYPSNKVNAFALPGGPIFITTGLLDMYRSQQISQDEMAFVLGHEFSHMRAGHGFSQQSKGIAAGILLTAISIFARNSDNQWIRDGAPLAAAIIAITILSSVSQDDELYCDSMATKENIGMGFDPHAGQSLLQKISGDPQVTGVQEIDNRCYFKTHPDISDRVNNIATLSSENDNSIQNYFQHPTVTPQYSTSTVFNTSHSTVNKQITSYSSPSVPPLSSINTISENNNVVTFLNLDNKTLSKNDILNIQLKSSFVITRLDTNITTLTGNSPVQISFNKIPLKDTTISYSITVKDIYGRTETKYFKIKY